MLRVYDGCVPYNLLQLYVLCVWMQSSFDPEQFVLHPQPLEYNYAEFERLLLGIAWHVYVTKKKGDRFEDVSVLWGSGGAGQSFELTPSSATQCLHAL